LGEIHGVNATVDVLNRDKLKINLSFLVMILYNTEMEQTKVWIRHCMTQSLINDRREASGAVEMKCACREAGSVGFLLNKNFNLQIFIKELCRVTVNRISIQSIHKASECGESKMLMGGAFRDSSHTEQGLDTSYMFNLLILVLNPLYFQ